MDIRQFPNIWLFTDIRLFPDIRIFLFSHLFKFFFEFTGENSCWSNFVGSGLELGPDIRWMAKSITASSGLLRRRIPRCARNHSVQCCPRKPTDEEPRAGRWKGQGKVTPAMQPLTAPWCQTRPWPGWRPPPPALLLAPSFLTRTLLPSSRWRWCTRNGNYWMWSDFSLGSQNRHFLILKTVFSFSIFHKKNNN